MWAASHLGRGLMRALLWPASLFFFVTGGAARRASHDYLRRARGREPRLAECLYHFWCFGACTLDRLLILRGRSGWLRLEDVDREQRRRFVSGQPCIILVSHVGSFEMLRQTGEQSGRIRLRVVLDRGQSPQLTTLLERLSPDFAASIVDSAQRGPGLVLALRETLDQGYSIGIMADRVAPGEPSVAVRLLDGEARLPIAPWVLAAVLNVPVIAAFGLYRGGRDYQLRFELLSAGLRVGRAERQAAIQSHAQAYAELIERQLREAPYNWFNFYSYWIDGRTKDGVNGGSDESAAG